MNNGINYIPKVSIITTTYNDVKNLKEIINCVLHQDYKNIEYIVIDGGSSDSTIEFIKEIEPSFNGNLKWISEKDKGIYDAINKGLKLATGDIIGCVFDLYTNNNVISMMVNTIITEGTDGVHSDLVYVKDDKIVRYWRMGNGLISMGWMPGFPTLYLKREVYDKYGVYKTDYKCSGDYEFIVRVLKDREVNLSYIPEVLIKMYYGGTSTGGLKSYWISITEAHRALCENSVHMPIIIVLLRTFRVMLQFLKK